MKKYIAVILLALATLFGGQPAGAKAEQKTDYSKIRGVCYLGWREDEATVRTQLGYAKRIGINSTRIWLGGYDRDPQGFIKSLKNYVKIANEMGISVMPILWNGNGLDPAILEESYWEEYGDGYVRATVNALKGMDGLLCWDIMNEPTCNDYYNKSPEDEKEARADKIFRFVRHYCQLVKEIAPKNDITVGVTYPKAIERASADLVDVISFHDYLQTRAEITASYELAKSIADKYGKQMINSETGCIGRSNPYDLALQIAGEYNVGWYIFELMIGGYWGDIHGIFYPDGTVRDPSIVAACLGIFRNRDLSTSVPEYPDKEGHVTAAIKLVEEAFSESKESFRSTRASTDAILEAAERCANLLEASQMVPMHDMPSAKIAAWRKQDPKDRNEKEIRKFAYDLVQLLKENCEIF